MKTAEKSKKKKDLLTDNRSERIRRKTANITANESSMAAELKNREHGLEQPDR